MKILLGYSYYENPFDVKQWVTDWLKRLGHGGIEIDPFCLTLDPPGGRLGWNRLEERWHKGDRKLFTMYRELLEKCKDYDVFLNWNGINLHPEFVKALPITKIYSCYDDPESSDTLSRPVAEAYDLCLVGNVAEVETYRSWCVKQAEFWPLGYFEAERDTSIDEAQILSGERSVDVTMLCERVSHWRKVRLDKFSGAFPQGSYYGHGWPNGYIDESEKLGLYRRTKIGLNIHNSTGPINFRTYMLPANGVMMLCDNKSHLAKIYKLGEEAVGFDTIEEAIELCQYYLDHDDERQKIAVTGWKRAVRDYNELASFNVGLDHIKKLPQKSFSDEDFEVAFKTLKQYQVKGIIKFCLFTIWLRRVQRSFCKLKRLFRKR